MRVASNVSLIVGMSLSIVATSYAQVTSRQAPEPRPTRPAVSTARVIVEGQPVAPQVVTILHRLNGIKMFRLLLRSGDQVRAITKLDEAFNLNSEVHTNVIAGFAMDDGTIAAWLPEAEAEMGAPFPVLAPVSPNPPVQPGAPMKTPPASRDQFSPTGMGGGFFERPNLTVIPNTGQRVTARYIGLDGLTGLSVLKATNVNQPQAPDAPEEGVSVGQRLRLFGPEPAPRPETRATTRVYVRMGEIEANVTKITRSPSGALANVKISSSKLSRASIGGVAVNDAGETVGIVDAVEGVEASILPSALVRSAAKRVIERQASVPRPWLGVRGEAVAALAVEQIRGRGWNSPEALALAEQQRGILLTSIAPGSPAAGAALRPGDVIVRVNDGEVRSAEDFSWLLQEAGPGTSVSFTVMKPSQPTPERIEIKLSESFDLLSSMGMFTDLQKQMREPESLLAHGIEAIALQPEVAARLGASGGLLVVSVQPAAAAAKAGLRSGDVIQAINGQRLVASRIPVRLATKPGSSYTFELVRNKQKIVLTYVSSGKASAPENDQ